ncbi:PIN-like domain-containing protein [Chelatococcus sp. GCM10030263]|uniref:PIN-like domain-containing protein n=1 Tax=Chelatococcus sp. GCM10030263 TaxID=3273387 RepID=UPI003623AB4C
MKFRVMHNIPPGYKDSQKPDGGAGDLIIWKTLLQVGADQQKDLVFVTLDQKSDWWSQADGAALFPRYELLEEYRFCSAGHTVHLLRFSEFLAEFGALPKVVTEVQRVEDEARNASEAEDAQEDKDLELVELFLALQSEDKRLDARISDLKRHLHSALNRKGEAARTRNYLQLLKAQRAQLRAQIHNLSQKFPYLLVREEDSSTRENETNE